MLVVFVRAGDGSRGRSDEEEGDMTCGRAEGAGHGVREWVLQCSL